MIRQIFKDVQGVELDAPFPRLSYAEAMRRYGSDKPDLRIAMELRDIASAVQGCELKVFAERANHPPGRVAELSVTGGATLSRKQSGDYAAYAGTYGAQGLEGRKVESQNRN